MTCPHDYHMHLCHMTISHAVCLCRYIVDRKRGDGTVCLHKEWAVHPEPFPLQVTIADISSFAPEYREQATTLTELFPIGSQCFITASTQYGCQAEVRGCARQMWRGGGRGVLSMAVGKGKTRVYVRLQFQSHCLCIAWLSEAEVKGVRLR